MFKLVSLSGVALGILSTVAVAADLPRRSAPAPFIAPPPVFTWTGFYVGINAGAAFRNNTNNNNNAFLFGGVAPFGVFPFGFNNGNNNRVAFIGGGQIGYNWQTGPVVFGLEVDFQYRSSFGNNNNFFFANNNNNSGNFLGTARGRLGYALAPQFMVYGTGGVAYGTVNNANVFNPFIPFGFNSNNNNFRVGYTIGGGVEYAFAPNWSIKGEYLFVDLGRPNNNNFFFFNQATPRFQFHVARVGVNYRFNWGSPAPVVARY